MFNIFSIVKFFKENFNKKDLVIIFFIILSFFATRLINLDSFPIFSDEGIYIKWAKTAKYDASTRFISLTDGKQPLQTWATIPFLKFFPENPLLAGRLFAVFSGFFALIGIFAVSFYLFGKNVAFISSFLYTITPFFLFFDRMALVDSMVNASYIWTFFLSIILVNTLRFDIALIFGLFSGIFLLSKSSVILFLLNSVFAWIFLLKNKKTFWKNLINFIILFFISIFIAFLIYNVQRLSPYLHYVAEKNKTFVMTLDEFLKSPFEVFWHNFRYIPYYVSHSIGYISFILGIAGIYLISKKKLITAFYIIVWLIIPYILMSFFMKLLSIRYTIFLAPLFIIGASYFLNYIFLNKKNLYLKFLITFISFIFTFYFSYTILFDFKNIPFPPFPAPSVDRGQYIEGWPAGWGVKEFIEEARKKSYEKPVIIIAEGNFGMAGDVLEAHLKPKDKITIKAYWPLKEENLKENQTFLDSNYIYVFFSHQNKFPENWPIKLIKKIKKPGGKSQFYIFELVK